MRRGLLAVLALAAVSPPSAGAATPAIHAHRGAPVVNLVPTYPENTLPAFEASAARGDVLELDAELTLDGKAIVLHDSTLDRTTVCSGNVFDRTLAQLAACPSDVLGSPNSVSGGTAPRDDVRVPLPSLADVLALARRTGARLNVEIKNVPTEAGFDPTPRFATLVAQELAAGGLAPGQLLVQSFWPPNLDFARKYLPGVPLVLLTLAQMNDGAPLYAKARGYSVISPAWPVRQQTIDLAHALGLEVVPYTLDTPDTVRAAAAAGVDGIITDDAAMARAALAP